MPNAESVAREALHVLVQPDGLFLLTNVNALEHAVFLFLRLLVFLCTKKIQHENSVDMDHFCKLYFGWSRDVFCNCHLTQHCNLFFFLKFLQKTQCQFKNQVAKVTFSVVCQ